MLIKTHPQAGYDILKDVDFPWPIADIVRQHHERLDGSGYPQGLKDGQILLESSIMAVADVVETMSSHRPYRPSWAWSSRSRKSSAAAAAPMILRSPMPVSNCSAREDSRFRFEARRAGPDRPIQAVAGDYSGSIDVYRAHIFPDVPSHNTIHPLPSLCLDMDFDSDRFRAIQHTVRSMFPGVALAPLCGRLLRRFRWAGGNSSGRASRRRYRRQRQREPVFRPAPRVRVR